MRLVLQRVHGASVTVAGEVILVHCVLPFSGSADAKYVTRKCLKARLWPEKDEDAEDCSKSWHLSVKDNKLEILLVSQFTLFGNLKKGNKPDFHQGAATQILNFPVDIAMSPQNAERLFNEVVELFKREYDADNIKTGCFGKYMSVDIQNDGPVTLFLDSSELQLTDGTSAKGN